MRGVSGATSQTSDSAGPGLDPESIPGLQKPGNTEAVRSPQLVHGLLDAIMQVINPVSLVQEERLCLLCCMNRMALDWAAK